MHRVFCLSPLREKVCEEERCWLEEERKREAHSRLEEEVWLQREREAQEKFRKQREKEEKLQREKEEREVWRQHFPQLLYTLG